MWHCGVNAYTASQPVIQSINYCATERSGFAQQQAQALALALVLAHIRGDIAVKLHSKCAHTKTTPQTCYKLKHVFYAYKLTHIPIHKRKQTKACTLVCVRSTRMHTQTHTHKLAHTHVCVCIIYMCIQRMENRACKYIRWSLHIRIPIRKPTHSRTCSLLYLCHRIVRVRPHLYIQIWGIYAQGHLHVRTHSFAQSPTT